MTEIEPLNPETINIPTSIVMIGKSGTGKTQMLHNLIYRNRKKIDEIYLFSHTGLIYRNDFFYIPKKNIYDHLDIPFIKNLFHERKEAAVAAVEAGDKKFKKIQTVIVLDDIIGDGEIRNKVIKDLFTEGRHYGLTIIMLSQVSKGVLNPDIRDNTKWIISFFQHDEDRRKQFVTNFISIHSKKDGARLYKEITRELYTAAVINLMAPIGDGYDGYLMKFKLKPEELKTPKFKIELPKLSNKKFARKGNVGFDYSYGYNHKKKSF